MVQSCSITILVPLCSTGFAAHQTQHFAFLASFSLLFVPREEVFGVATDQALPGDPSQASNVAPGEARTWTHAQS